MKLVQILNKTYDILMEYFEAEQILTTGKHLKGGEKDGRQKSRTNKRNAKNRRKTKRRTYPSSYF